MTLEDAMDLHKTTHSEWTHRERVTIAKHAATLSNKNIPKRPLAERTL